MDFRNFFRRSIVGLDSFVVLQSIPIIDQIHIAEILVSIGGSVLILVTRRVLASRSAGLNVSITIRADYNGRLVIVIETIVATFA